MTEPNAVHPIETPIERSRKAAAWLGKKLGATKPELLLVLGSGLGQIADQLEQPISIPYEQIPGFPTSTVLGHAGRLVSGFWQGRSILVMQGRFHAYEGYSAAELVIPIRAARLLGIDGLILTNAAGGINPAFAPGDLMLIDDHIGLMAESPLRGPNDESIGVRFPDQTAVYDRRWRQKALDAADSLKIHLQHGVYAYTRGPQYETPAEIRALTRLGADAVGMSTVPEAIAASHCGMRVLAISCISNFAAGIKDQPLSHAEVMAVGAKAGEKTARLLAELIQELK